MPRPPYSVTIRELREKRGYTQEAIATLAGISVRTLRAVEAGESSPRAALLIRILDALNADRDHRAACMGAK